MRYKTATFLSGYDAHRQVLYCIVWLSHSFKVNSLFNFKYYNSCALLKDTDDHIANETLIVDNNDVVPATAVITDHSYATDEHLCGRTWLNDNRTQGLDEVHVFRGAHLAVDPDLAE